MIEEATREARRNQLKAANQALQLDRPNAAAKAIEFDPFAEDAIPAPSKVGGKKGSPLSVHCYCCVSCSHIVRTQEADRNERAQWQWNGAEASFDIVWTARYQRCEEGRHRTTESF